MTGFVKTLRMGFFVNIEFDAYLISSTLELTHLQVETDRALHFGDSALCLRSRYNHRKREVTV